MEFEHIIMKCQDEKTDYPTPSEMFNKDGTCKYAYVTLVMLGDTYIAGAIIVAYSVRKAGSQADLVALVTYDVSEEGKNILRKFFTRVIEVDFIKVPNWRVKSQPHRKYLELVFTKFHLFNLTQYEKVLLIDADAIVLAHPDHLFTLNAPAGSLIEYKDQLISYDSRGNYVYPKDGELKWYKEMCKCCAHGKKIDKSITDKVLKDHKNSGIAAGLWLLEPKEGELNRILKDVATGKSKWLVEQKYVWPEQQYLTGFYSGKWTSINPRFYGLQGYPHWSVLYGVQYAGDKPFVAQSKAPISERIKYADFIVWHQFYGQLLKTYPELYESKSLKEANEMNKFFQTRVKEQHRMIKRSHQILPTAVTERVDKKILAKLFLKNEDAFDDSQLKYYHIDCDHDYHNHKLKPMFNDIANGDYTEPIVRLAEYFGTQSYYSELLKKIQENNVEQTDQDLIMLEYIKSKQDMFVFTFWPIVLQKMSPNEIVTCVKKYGEIVHIKNITINYNTLFNLIYWMYDDITYSSRFEFVTKKMSYMQLSESNQLLIIFFQNVGNTKITQIKEEIRKELLESLKQHINKKIEGSDIVHINDFFYQTINYAKMILNGNTLKMISHQNVKNIASQMFCSSRLKLETFKKWTQLNLSQLELERIVVMGNPILFSYGICIVNNINAILIDISHGESQAEEELAKLINDNFQTKLFFADIGIENHSRYWKKSWSEKNNKIINYFDVESMNEIATNPDNYYYFNGIRMYLPKFEIYRKLQRNMKHDHADFLMLSTLYPTLVSQFVRMESGKLIYDVKEEIKEPILNHDYLKSLLKIIYERYPKDDIDKFKKIVQLI